MPKNVQIVNENECMGDSLTKINENFEALKIIVDAIKSGSFSDPNAAVQILNSIKGELNL